MDKYMDICNVRLVKEKTTKYDFRVSKAEDVYRLAKMVGYDEYAEEVLGIFCFNSRGEVVTYFEVSRGDLNGSMMHPREVFKRAILANAGSFVLVHNHPSGCPEPSEEDKESTKRLKKAGDLIGIPLIDHVVVGNKGFASMKAEGMIDV